MRIGFVTYEYTNYSFLGGGTVYAENLTKELAKLGHDVFVFVPKMNDQIIKIKVPNLKVIPITINNKIPFISLQFWFKLHEILKKAEKEYNFDIIHVNGCISYGFLKKRIINVPHFFTCHHLLADAIENNNSTFLARFTKSENNFIMPFFERRCLKLTDKIIASSEFTKSQIIKNYKIPPSKIEIVYLGTDLNGYDYTETELNEFKRRINLPDKPSVLFVGRIDDPRKGLDVLLNAFKMVLKRVDAILIVIGKGNPNKIMKQIDSLGITKNIFLIGFVDENTLKKFYSLCDLYVCPSRLEGFGLTIIEAIAAGKPIVATKVGAIPEIIKDESMGILVPSDDWNCIAQAILCCLSIEPKSKILKVKNLNYLKENFNWKKCAEETLIAYNGVINEDK
jgi:glycosyltransferase involved in cell wall biosynthesis